MTSPIEVRSNLKLTKVVDDIIADRQKKFERAMEEAAREIVERTASGRDVNGRAFKKYSTSYAAFKKAKGRKTNPVDLTFTGKMLANVTTTFMRTATELIGRITFSSQAEANKARWNMETRKFFELSQKQRKAIVDKLK